MKVLWTVAALRHLREIGEYLGDESVQGAISVRRRILATKRRIAQAPNCGRIGRVEGTREAVVPRTAYIFVYRVSEQAIEILGIWHGARLWPDVF